MPYQPIESYGVIGNLRTAALVGQDGSIDWMCLPRFDSPSVFGAVLDDAKGGRFRIAPGVEGARHKQFYWPDTNVLVTRFLHPDGIMELIDFMPVPRPGDACEHQLVRRVRVVTGELSVKVECRPAFDYARAEHAAYPDECGVRFDGPGLCLALSSPIDLRVAGGGATGEVSLRAGEERTFVLQVVAPGHKQEGCPTAAGAAELFQRTVDYWHAWLAKCTYKGRWRDQVYRSALALKLLTYEPTGAIVAALTTSLPEGIGGVRNWDYRFTWIRDAAFTVYAFLRIGFTEEAVRFMDWLRHRWRNPDAHCDGPLQLMYGIGGESELDEFELPHLDGYKGSKPVRIGNGAHGQLQLDIYGELMDAVYLFNKYASPITYDDWVRLRGMIDWVAGNWQRQDEGIWEVRGGRRDFVYSRVLCWVALDRGLRLADKRSLPADRARWLAARDAILDEVMTRGWSGDRKAFVQSYGSDALDASLLLLPLVFFTAPNDPRMLSTLDAVRRPLEAGGLAADGLVYRYNPEHAPDGLPGTEGTFNMCSFWLIEALTRAGRTDPKLLAEARLRFEQMLGYASQLGLYAEQTGPSGEALGNFPQAFTHLGLISAAFNLDRALSGK
ncbi:glycosyl hydrolase family 15 : Glycoside hydrolase OS=planctomycete KSU-1 GN=KSU1_C0777 PE=4 SV=1: Glyco_hydro_15 [Gemmataceae bacterium]|nr:glycosyl hydrolase family 15 : Glycoside hydrolase OS=planctomycete KSU-1 GN=KSU1_C0777 PE=4 SV=1: Glyco_hydro_15 [Gemmataceae bacterium]VTT99411.1 glycosyl hydrolase family 15 : Glycoside hydrolase OS=planctomycete KSU-1 GN=KSU1_C0777 PE=4 SV=1: Glyco_hydro_15 [Gemmataceae bacterium]